MKTIKFLFMIIMILFIGIMSSCDEGQTDTAFNRLEPPIVVIAKSANLESVDKSKSNSITVIDKNTKIRTFKTAYILGASLYNTFNIGDTIVKK